MLSLFRKHLTVVVSVLAIAFSIAVPVAAQNGTATGGGSGLSVSPTRYDLQIAPGTSQDIKISLKNISGADISAKAVVNDFSADGTTGEPKIITNQNINDAQSIRSFLTNVVDVPLAKNASQTVTITVSVPKNAAPGAYYGIIRYAAVPQNVTTDQTNNVSLTASVGVVVLLTVPGNVKEQVQVTGVSAYKDTVATNSSSFFIHPPQAVGVAIKNLGNGFASPFGNVNVDNILGHQVYTYQINNTDPRGVVLPNSSRIFKDVIKGVKLPGRYTITANVSYGSGGQVLTVKSDFWYLPVWAIIVLVAVFTLLLAVAYVLYRRLSRRPAKLRRK